MKKKKKDYIIGYKKRYEAWKKDALNQSGFFVIFNGFLEEKQNISNKALLQEISGGALKLYIFLGIKSNNFTGESYYSIKSISEYFNKSERTINNWIHELEKLNLIYRAQLKYNGVSHTYLQTYKTGQREKRKSND